MDETQDDVLQLYVPPEAAFTQAYETAFTVVDCLSCGKLLPAGFANPITGFAWCSSCVEPPVANDDRPQETYQPHNVLCSNCGLVFPESQQYINGQGQGLCKLCAATEDQQKPSPDFPA